MADIVLCTISTITITITITIYMWPDTIFYNVSPFFLLFAESMLNIYLMVY
jgi:hypothetical protein